MYLVVDPNVLISALIMKGNASRVFSLNSIIQKFDLIAPNFLILEVGRNTERIAKKTHFSQEEIEEQVEFLMSEITIIPDEEYRHKLLEARQLLKEHEKDVTYLALALAFNCKIFSGDKTLKELIPEMVFTPREILEGFF